MHFVSFHLRLLLPFPIKEQHQHNVCCGSNKTPEYSFLLLFLVLPTQNKFRGKEWPLHTFLNENKIENTWLDVRTLIKTDSSFRKATVNWESTLHQYEKLVVKDKQNILCDVKTAGDEAMIYAKKLPHATVIVSEDRVVAIEKAKAMGCEIVFLDDAYSKHGIKKLDIIF